MQNHLETLKAKHTQLEKSIMEEHLRPCPNPHLIIELKQKKLRIKEQIYTLSRGEV
jgi:hypothetical protein